MTVAASEWRLCPIGAIASTRLGGNYRNGPTPSSRPLIKMGNIARITIDLSRLEFIPESESVDPVHRLKYGDILFNTRNTLELVGKISIWRDELPVAYYNSNILRFEFKPDYCGDSRYFGYALNSSRSIDAIRALATGTTSVAAVYTRDLLKMEVPVPPKEEQRRIAGALADADGLITALQRQIVKKQAIKQGMMQELLTGRTRLPGFTEDWTNLQWSDVTSQRAGNGQIKGKLSAVRTSQYEYPGYSASGPDVWLEAFDFEGPGVVVSAVGSRCGKSFLAHGRWSAIANTHIVLPVSGRLDPCFAILHFDDEAFWIKGGSGQPFVQMRASLTQNVRLPAMEEQRAIANVLFEAEDEIVLLKDKFDKARAVKHGMMQQLLTGRTRLPVEEPA